MVIKKTAVDDHGYGRIAVNETIVIPTRAIVLFFHLLLILGFVILILGVNESSWTEYEQYWFELEFEFVRVGLSSSSLELSTKIGLELSSIVRWARKTYLLPLYQQNSYIFFLGCLRKTITFIKNDNFFISTLSHYPHFFYLL